jgi:D-hexose-6-phosphate mutarotase
VPDISQISISGLPAGVNYKDKVLGGAEHETDGGPLTITSETDR